ncbi:MAG: phosphatase PAP2 family protein, partial [Tissierellia bacterium]|nr:phosphatase PAP2 family protein [Tissierellia bacterium]
MFKRRKKEFLNRKNLMAIIAFVLVIAIGIITKFTSGGISGEENIYYILGGTNRNIILLNIAKVFAFIGSPKFLIPTISAFFLFTIYTNKRLFSLGLLISTAGSFILNHTIKTIFQRPRPLDFMLMTETSYSYPSGHTMTNTCIYLFLAYYFSKDKDDNTKSLYYAIAIMISGIMGMSRVYLGVHYISDVVGGFLAAYFFYHFSTEFLKKSK